MQEGLVIGLYYKSHDNIIYKVITEVEVSDTDNLPIRVYVLKDENGKFYTVPVLSDYSNWECVIPDSKCILKEVK